MSSSTGLDFNKIRADSLRQCEQINALRAELRDLLSSHSATPEKKAQKPPLPESRPVLLSRMDRIQSRLSLLASSLSPSQRSTRSTPRNRPASADSPRRKVEHFPISTPRHEEVGDSSSSDEEDIVYDISKERISKKVKEIGHTLNSKISELYAVKESLQDANARVVAQMNERERLSLAAFVEELHKTSNSSNERLEFDSLIRGELDSIRSKNNQEISAAIKDCFGLSELKESVLRFQTEIEKDSHSSSDQFKSIVRSIEGKVDEAMQQVNDNCRFELSKLRNELESQISGLSVGTENVETQKLVDENRKLRQALRRARIALAKWQTDYISQRREPVVIAEKRTHVPNVIVGESLPGLLQTLAKMWTALPPSAQECVDLLGGIQSAALSNGSISLADIVKQECSRHVEKLPIAELVARREFLLAKHTLSQPERKELEAISENVWTLIAEYEGKYQQHFMYEGVDYMQSMHRANFRS